MGYRIAMVSVVVLLGAGLAEAGYEFSLSASNTDPSQCSVGASGQQREVYLWLKCSDASLSALEARLVTSLPVLGFSTSSVNLGDDVELLLGVAGCPSDTAIVLGHWTVWDSGGTMCLSTSSANGRMVAVDCDGQGTLMPVVHGFSSGALQPCAHGINGCTQSAAAGQGLVISFGEILEPPFTFTGVGSEALLLNGRQYFPRPYVTVRGTSLPGPTDLSFVDSMQAARDAADSASRGLRGAAWVRKQVEMLQSSDQVLDIRIAADELAFSVRWKETGWEMFDSRVAPVRASTPVVKDDPTAYHESLMKEFWHAVNTGRAVAFGDDYLLIGGSASATARTRRALQLLAVGEEPVDSLITNTVLNDARVRRSLVVGPFGED